MYQAICGTVKSTESLLAHKPPALPNLKDRIGRTALHHAVHSDDPAAKLRLLLDYGADKTIRNNDGQTALDLARNRISPWECTEVLESYTPKLKG